MQRVTAAFALVLAGLALAACNSTDRGSGISALTAPDPAGGANGADGRNAGTSLALNVPQPNTADANAAPVANATTIAFAPAIGAPSEVVPTLTRSLTARAAQRGITVTGSTAGAGQILKGYFSAIAEGSKTTVIYVWDVLDTSGTRLHRIQGQQSVAGGSGDGWSSVTAATMQAIGVATIDAYAEWLSGRQTAAQ